MRCVECTKHVCRKCLTLEPEAAWDIEFCCPPCLVDGLFTLPCDDRPGPDYLLHLALQSLKSSSARLALSTWRSYHRCVQKVVEFMAKQGVVTVFSCDDYCFGTGMHVVFPAFTSEWGYLEYHAHISKCV